MTRMRSAKPKPTAEPSRPSAGRSLLASIDGLGAAFLKRSALVVDTIGLLMLVLTRVLRPLTWRRPVRREFGRQLYLAGVAALPSFTVLGVLVGGALVFQAVFWLEAVGDIELVAQLLVRTLVQEVAPVLVAVVLVGRTGVVLAGELMNLRASGQIDALSAMGLDTTSVLVLPRVLGFTAANVALTVVFTAVALISGFALANIAGVGRANLVESVDTVLGRIEPGVYLSVLIKSVLAGLLVGAVCCRHALVGERPDGRLSILSHTFVESLLVIFLVAGVVSLLL